MRNGQFLCSVVLHRTIAEMSDLRASALGPQVVPATRKRRTIDREKQTVYTFFPLKVDYPQTFKLREVNAKGDFGYYTSGTTVLKLTREQAMAFGRVCDQSLASDTLFTGTY